ncbi:unnamed protein product [Owenia fusiformis]|uniref:Sidoreflexin n=1 Tax=Owenia fusiformis TaxID=6347 RepID=A0A8J1T542_OWEFU|nr:unnamed protein product [Owenia fusiformis]
MAESNGRLNIDKPLWDQSTFIGRVKHFFWVTDPRTIFTSDKKLDAARDLVEQYRRGEEPPGVSREEIVYAKKLFESAFHPDSGERQNVIGRMSFQVPGGMAITGAMLQWYKTNTAVIFWQWVNQSFNALVNYTNRNAASDITAQQIGLAYVTATTSAVVTAIGLKKFLAKRAGPFAQRFVPFAAVAAANCVNVPLMRQSEITNGIMTTDEDENEVVPSKYAAGKGIGQVVFSRITMAAPGMLITPIIMNRIEPMKFMQRIKPLHGPIQIMVVGCFLIFMTPTACAIFPQRCQISSEKLKVLDKEKLEEIQQKFGEKVPKTLYFNKGL